MEFELSKIDAAVDQLDWAIRLFLDHKAYVPAITLAGAADEILGQAVGSRAAFDVLKKICGGFFLAGKSCLTSSPQQSKRLVEALGCTRR